MGICFYFMRPDNKTVFDMDKAYGLGEILCPGDYHLKGEAPVALNDIETALVLWYEKWPEFRGTGEEQVLAKAIIDFADGNHIYYVTEHHHWMDEWFFDCQRKVEERGDRWDIVMAHRKARLP